MATTDLPLPTTPSIPSRKRRRTSQDLIFRKMVRLGTLLVIQAAVVLVLLEIVGRVFDPLGISYYPETARYLDTMIIEEPIGYRNRPNLSGRFHGATYTTNSIGLRNDEIPVAKQPNEYRVLMLGDSVVFGLGVENDETIPQVVERLANEQNRTARHVRVINMGVPSYNTEQELIQLLSLGMSLQPDAVVLLNRPNDIEPKMWVFEKRASRWIDLVQRSYAACFLFRLQQQLKQIMATTGHTAYDGEYQLGNSRWQLIDDSLTDINKVCRTAQIPFLLLVAGSRDRKPYYLHYEVAEREGFAIDTLDPWRDPRWKDLDRTRYINSVTDQHANRDGCILHGIQVYEMLVRHHIIR